MLTQLGGTVDPWTRRETPGLQPGRPERLLSSRSTRTTRPPSSSATAASARYHGSGAQITATYRVGGGLAGNVLGQHRDHHRRCPATGPARRHGDQPAPATGGADRESIEHAVQQAPAVFRSLRRAVTAADYQALALSFKGVGKVQRRRHRLEHGDALRRAGRAAARSATCWRRAQGLLRGQADAQPDRRGRRRGLRADLRDGRDRRRELLRPRRRGRQRAAGRGRPAGLRQASTSARPSI